MIKNSISNIKKKIDYIANTVSLELKLGNKFKLDEEFTAYSDYFEIKFIEKTCHDAPDTIVVNIPFWTYDRLDKFTDKGKVLMLSHWLHKEYGEYTFKDKSKEKRTCAICEEQKNIIVSNVSEWECDICGHINII